MLKLAFVLILILSLCCVMPICAQTQVKNSSADESAGQSARKASPQPVTLYGRIEQLVNQKGAVLPRQLQKMTPILDLNAGASKQADLPLTGQVVKSFPDEWEGIWKGNVTVIKQENLELCWLSQPAATYRSLQFFKPGAKLSLLCRFHREGGQLELSPPVVRGQFKHVEDLVQAIVSENMDEINSVGKVRLGLTDFGKTVPIERIESFSFGKRYGPSVGGNFIDSEVLSNQLRELAPGVIEQDIVTSGTTQSMYGAPAPVTSMGESVVRFTRREGKMLVNLAYVNYQHDGICISKCVLEGTLERAGE